MTVELLKFSSRDEASEALAAAITGQLADDLAEHSSASLVVSGGTSPAGVFHRLAASPLAWNNVQVLPSDERVVAEGDPASNLGMIRRELARDRAGKARLIGLLPDADGAFGTAEGQLDKLRRPLTHVMLGMGADGHTASLFPDAPQLQAALASDAPLMILSPPSADQQRVSLTPAWLLDAQHISLLIFGQEKLEVLARARATGPVTQYPVRCILHQDRAPVDIYWAP